jgi:hypothetical protein
MLHWPKAELANSNYSTSHALIGQPPTHLRRATFPIGNLSTFSVEHTNALDRAVVGNPLAELPSTGQSNRLGGRSNRLGQEDRRKPKIVAPRGTPSRTTHIGLF